MALKQQLLVDFHING